jgi:HTH-type transcriptional regulator/antitoxin HigA
VRERRVERMRDAVSWNARKYSMLANRIVVKAIENEEEYDRIVAAIEGLMDRGEENLGPEEAALLETLGILVQAYDERTAEVTRVTGAEMLAHLMETSGKAPKDLLEVFGTRGRVSEILRGKRSISKEQAKRLGALFRVGADLFL